MTAAASTSTNWISRFLSWEGKSRTWGMFLTWHVVNNGSGGTCNYHLNSICLHTWICVFWIYDVEGFFDIHVLGFACVALHKIKCSWHCFMNLPLDFFFFGGNRQMLDSAVRAHRKQMMSIQSAVSNIGLSESVKDQIPPPPSPELSLHKGKHHRNNH